MATGTINEYAITTNKTVVEVSGGWEHLYIVFEKTEKIVVARVMVKLTGNSGIGIRTYSDAIPVGFRPRNEVYPDGSGQSYVAASVERNDSGTQGQGTIQFSSDGTIQFGINQAGVSGVYLSTHLTYFAD